MNKTEKIVSDIRNIAEIQLNDLLSKIGSELRIKLKSVPIEKRANAQVKIYRYLINVILECL